VIRDSDPMQVRQIQPDEWRAYRAIRLAALAEAPDAFGSSLAREQAMPDERWRERTTAGEPGKQHALFVAVADDDRWVGLAGSFTPGDPPADTELISMWVDPGVRGSGTGAALVGAVGDWARSIGFASIGLWVTESNDRAHRLYQRCGFTDTGERQPLPSNPTLQEVRMLRSL
jgi:GNAT superfamily N-acetyltransferase